MEICLLIILDMALLQVYRVHIYLQTVSSYIYICILFITLFVGIFTSERKEAAVNRMLLAQLLAI